MKQIVYPNRVLFVLPMVNSTCAVSKKEHTRNTKAHYVYETAINKNLT